MIEGTVAGTTSATCNEPWATIFGPTHGRGISQEVFAGVLGVHRTCMGAIERGERNLTPGSVERLGERLDVAPARELLMTR